jgi:polyhydroxyalkanoate synthesis regulator phasin
MTIEYNQSLLASISSQNPDINSAVAQTNQYTEMCKNGQLTKEEYLELLQDVQSQVNIQKNMAELDAMEKLNTAINALILIAKTV